MGKRATENDMSLGAIPMTLGNEDDENPNLDLISDDEDDEDPAIVALREEMDELKTSQQDERQFLQDTILEMSSRPAAVAPAAPLKQIANKLDLADLPDPVENREEFYSKLGDKVTNFVNAQSVMTTAALASESHKQQGLMDLENRFSRDHKTLAGKPALFQATVTQEVAKMKNRGVDAQKLIFANPDKFLTGIAKSMRDELGIEDDEDEGDDNVVDIKTRTKKSRAVGVKGGSMPKLKKGAGQKGKKPLGFVQEIRRQQHEMGLI